jgi:RimJ/RimL family protein N-acetyltransferase
VVCTLDHGHLLVRGSDRAGIGRVAYAKDKLVVWWNKGYGTEAVELMVKYGFEMLNMHRIWLRVFERNKRAIRTYEKVGFIHEGQLRESDYKEGKYHNI